MGDLEQFEVSMLRRDHEIDQYDAWYQEVKDEIEAAVWHTLLSWISYEEYCPRCGKFKSADKTSTDHEFYQYECGHYGYRWDNTHDWDDEIQGWVPKGGTC